jgi:hypothetical protein
MGRRGRKSGAEIGMANVVDVQRLQGATPAQLAHWRQLYDVAQHPDFRFDVGGRHWIKGAEARRRHYVMNGIPRALVAAWDAEEAARTKA